MAKKKGAMDMGKYISSEEDLRAYSWCINNNIYISPWCKDNSSWYIDIVINGNSNKSPEAYKKNEIWKKLYEYYRYYYDKYRK